MRASVHERSLRALLNLCQAPEVNRYVRERHDSRCKRLAESFIAEARRRVTGELMAELLMLLSMLVLKRGFHKTRNRRCTQ